MNAMYRRWGLDTLISLWLSLTLPVTGKLYGLSTGLVDCIAVECGLTKMGFCPSLDERYLTGALNESVQEKEWPLKNWDLLRESRKLWFGLWMTFLCLVHDQDIVGQSDL